ncbi:MAG TPA: hypothetical protein VKD90_00485 [Gemmataceae bacterium]|nr:hypothetical protein [Gemmataceae bacterium]
MKGFWLIVAAAVAGSAGCGTAPKREMRGPTAEEFTNPSEQYRTPPDVPSDRPGLAPKSGTPMPMGVGVPGSGFGSPGMSPGMGPAGGMHR